MSDDLSRTFLGSGPAGYGVSSVMGAVLTAWDPATYACTVTDGAYTFTDCLVMHPSLLVPGRVLLQFTPAGPVILGNTYQRPPAVDTGGGTNPGAGTSTGTGGTGGPLTDRTDVSFTNSSGVTSAGHIYANGLDWTKNVGILVYTDGSGDFGLANPSSTYLLAGTDGLIAKAKAHNMVLVALRAPGDGCTDGDGVCWYLASFDGTPLAAKIKWADDFIRDQVLTRYNIDTSRACIAGYSSGAQFTMEYYGPQYASAWMTDGLLLGISYGGSPKVTPNYPAPFKAAVSAVWDVGDADPAYQSSGVYGVQAGYDWYGTNGFATTELTVVAGEDHARDGLFGAIVDREITQHVRAAS